MCYFKCFISASAHLLGLFDEGSREVPCLGPLGVLLLINFRTWSRSILLSFLIRKTGIASASQMRCALVVGTLCKLGTLFPLSEGALLADWASCIFTSAWPFSPSFLTRKQSWDVEACCHMLLEYLFCRFLFVSFKKNFSKRVALHYFLWNFKIFSPTNV